VNAPFYVSYALMWILLVGLGVVVLGLAQTVYRQAAGSELQPAQGNPIGELVPEFTGVDLAGRTFQRDDLFGRTTAVLFVSPSCPSCAATLEELNALGLKSEGSVLVVCRSSPERCRRLTESYDVDIPVLADVDFAISKAFAVTTVPTAVLVDEEARFQSYGNPMRGEELVEIFDDQVAANGQGADGQIHAKEAI
jgi:peroxiredoxin